jgi:hypothetical protein
MVEVKGTAVNVVAEFVKARHGSAGFTRWMEALGQKARGIFASPVYSNVWYPLDAAFTEPAARVCELFYGGSRTGAVKIGEFSADRALRGVYKFFVKIGSPEWLLTRASSVFSTYYRPARMDSVAEGRGRAHLTVSEFAGMSPIVEARIEGWVARSLEISGCTDVRVAVSESMAYGQAVTRFDLTWRP